MTRRLPLLLLLPLLATAVASADDDPESGPPLKIELIAPGKGPVVIPQEAMDKAAKVAETLKTLMQSDKPREHLEEMRKLEAKLAEGRTLQQGVTLKLRIINTSDKPVALRYGPDTSTNHLTLEGPGAVALPFKGMMTMEFRMPDPITIKAGKSEEFSIKELRHGSRNMDRWLITKPGTYTASLRLAVSMPGEKFVRETGKVTFEVKAGS